MDEQKQQLIDRLKQAQNILVTVSANPSVDQLASMIGLSLVINKLGKHGTAVFSGAVPSTIEFLKPSEMVEKTTDSLRDFIIALDKSKADKLRYKVEDDVVRIFITPYKTSITDKDLQFSQGDFNVDVVIALGVTDPNDLDTAITAHGRILHDATVVSVSTVGQGSLGSINWVDPGASSLSEMALSLSDSLDKKAIDAQIATAFLTGIVAATERFRNDKTSPKAMSASAALMAAGANQQLIASELEAPEPEPEPTPEPEPEVPPVAPEEPEEAPDAVEEVPAPEEATPAPDMPELEAPEPEPEPEPTPEPEPPKEPGMLEINHDSEVEEDIDHTDEPDAAEANDESNEDSEPAPEPEQPEIHVDDEGKLTLAAEEAGEVKRERITEPPQVGDTQLTANTRPEELDPPTEELSLPSLQSPPLLTHDVSTLSTPSPLQPAPINWQPPVAQPNETLSQIEQSVDSPHLDMTDGTAAHDPTAHVNDARSAVEAALNGPAAPADPLAPVAAVTADPLSLDAQQAVSAVPDMPPLPPVPNTGFSEPTPGNSPADQTLDMPIPSSGFAAANPLISPTGSPSAFPGAPQPGAGNDGGQAPPPVPPPMLPPLQ